SCSRRKIMLIVTRTYEYGRITTRRPRPPKRPRRSLPPHARQFSASSPGPVLPWSHCLSVSSSHGPAFPALPPHEHFTIHTTHDVSRVTRRASRFISICVHPRQICG